MILVSLYTGNTIILYLVNVCTARFVYPESKFTAGALPRFVDVIKTAVAAVLNDGGFRLASVPVTTTTVLNTATQLVDWMSLSITTSTQFVP